MEMIVTETAILFFDPGFAESSRLTSVGIGDIKNVRVNFSNGSTLVVRTADARIECDTSKSSGAQPILEIIRERFLRSKNSNWQQ